MKSVWMIVGDVGVSAPLIERLESKLLAEDDCSVGQRRCQACAAIHVERCNIVLNMRHVIINLSTLRPLVVHAPSNKDKHM